MLRDAWRLALGTLTVVRARPPEVVDRRRAGLAMLLAPLAVLPLAAVAGVVVRGGDLLEVPGLVVGLLVVGALALGTRALHLDGLADLADGLTASYDRERSLAVMTTGTAGPAGVVALVLALGLQAAALAALVGARGSSSAWLVAAAVCVSRAALVICCLRPVPGARQDGLGSTFVGTVSVATGGALWIVGGFVVSGAAAVAGLPWWQGPLAVGLALVAVVAVVLRAVRRLGGVTGDVFGACIEIALVVLLVGLSAGG